MADDLDSRLKAWEARMAAKREEERLRVDEPLAPPPPKNARDIALGAATTILVFPPGFEVAYDQHLAFSRTLKVAGVYPALKVYGLAAPPGLATYVYPLPRSYPLQATMAPDSLMIALLRKGSGPLVELPVPIAAGHHLAHQPQAEAMYRSIFHWRPILNGYSGYWPRGFPERMALARALPDAAALETLRRETGLTQVLVHLAALPTEERLRWMNVAAGRGNPALRLTGVDGRDLLFDVGEARFDHPPSERPD